MILCVNLILKGDGERYFGTTPSTCASRVPDNSSDWKNSVLIALGAICGVLLVAFLGTLFVYGACRNTDYERIDSDDEMNNRK